MNELTLEGIESNDEVIAAATDHMAFFLFSILSDCYPEIATSEFENIFNEDFKVDIENFIKNYRKNIRNRMMMSSRDLAQIYSSQRFYEKLSRALQQCKKVKLSEGIENNVRSVLVDLPMK
ncbi:hypothetical protein [Pantoea stewartii]|uniref:hypothetical protein n=1 Tax=Pantoea stewartii TaxID=66269 RepID=UPI0007365604|nr:hypothetical protein [Pantoea stewartii]KTS28542.1 hypothetical protein NS381_08575 [Pantoea stewartii]